MINLDTLKSVVTRVCNKVLAEVTVDLCQRPEVTKKNDYAYVSFQIADKQPMEAIEDVLVTNAVNLMKIHLEREGKKFFPGNTFMECDPFPQVHGDCRCIDIPIGTTPLAMFIYERQEELIVVIAVGISDEEAS